MELEKVNHVITVVMEMLDGLVDAGVIGVELRKEFGPVIVQIVLKNETITMPESE